jgi:hypothetical protein
VSTSGYGTSGSPDALAVLVERFRREKRYPRRVDVEALAARRDLLRTLSPAALDAAIADPRVVHVQEFRRIASNAYGGPGNQIQINVYLRGGPGAVPALARTIRHLLYGPSSEVGRLDDVLEVSAWKVRGFGEALAVKCLAIVYPDRWLPLFLYPGKNGKQAMMRLSELPVDPLPEHGKSRAELAIESNNALRTILLPYFRDDAWGPVQFLWWRLQSAYGNLLRRTRDRG